MEPIGVQIARKELEIRRAEQQVENLKKELEILHMQASSIPAEAVKLPAPEASRSKILVVTTGPKMGIYHNYADIQGVPATSYTEASSMFEAERTLQTAKKAEEARKAKAPKLVQRMDRWIERGITEKVMGLVQEEVMSMAEWNILFENAKTFQEKGNKAYPIIRKDKMKVVTMKGCEPKLVYDLYRAGILDTVYTTYELDELSGFSKQFREKVRDYVRRSQIVKFKRDCYFSMISTIPDWAGDVRYPAYHLIKGGVVSKDYIMPDMVQAARGDGVFTTWQLAALRADLIDEMTFTLSNFRDTDKLRIYYDFKNVLFYAWAPAFITEADLKTFHEWREKMHIDNILISEYTRKALLRELPEEGAMDMDEGGPSNAEEPLDDRMEDDTEVPGIWKPTVRSRARIGAKASRELEIIVLRDENQLPKNMETIHAIDRIKSSMKNSQKVSAIQELEKLAKIYEIDLNEAKTYATKDNWWGDILPVRQDKAEKLKKIIQQVKDL
ncbi:hypothetical protein SLEP1_g59633 [Rubroshorea leprosula]|uniref:Portal protein n=1 Tax=Rubroshorea leprosula TaxID=152421 RepID=A0AAV5MXG9_9ROSI|nr:hypothetical protein SLEP1_g59633 [Rubroshorea leprosula]